MKYYYTDPLKAAWMMKEHGIKLVTKQNDQLYWKDGRIVFVAPHPTLEGSTLACESGDSHYVHPDCIELLRPQVGDLVESLENDWFAPIEKIETYYDYAIKKYGKDYNHNYDDTKEKCDAQTEKDKDCLVLHGQYMEDVAFWEGLPDEFIKIIQRNGKAFFMPEIEGE